MGVTTILLEGVGGIGGVIAGKLIRAGHGPTLVTGNREISEAINRSGLTVIEPGGRFTVATRAFASLTELPSEARRASSLGSTGRTGTRISILSKRAEPSRLQ